MKFIFNNFYYFLLLEPTDQASKIIVYIKNKKNLSCILKINYLSKNFFQYTCTLLTTKGTLGMKILNNANIPYFAVFNAENWFGDSTGKSA